MYVLPFVKTGYFRLYLFHYQLDFCIVILKIGFSLVDLCRLISITNIYAIEIEVN